MRGKCECVNVCLFTCGQNCKFVNCEWGYVLTFYPSPTSQCICFIVLSRIACNCVRLYVCMYAYYLVLYFSSSFSFSIFYYCTLILLLLRLLGISWFGWEHICMYKCGWCSINSNGCMYVCMYVREFIILYMYLAIATMTGISQYYI